MNYIKTGLLLVVLTIIFVWIGGYFGGTTGAMYAFIFAFIMNMAAYWFSDRIILMMYGAKEVQENEVPELYIIVKELASRSRLPLPRIYITQHPTPNAFATGRNPSHAAICVTQGILNLLNREELKGVIAHELSHIKNRDTLIMTITATIAGAITMLANMGRWTLLFGGRDSRDRNNNAIGLLIMLIVAPIAALLIQLAISRTREYSADANGARMAGTARGLSQALLKLEDAVKARPMQGNEATAHLFIVNPLSAESIAVLFSTHPPIKKRVELLEKMQI